MKVKLLRVGNEEYFEENLKGIPDADDAPTQEAPEPDVNDEVPF